MSYLKIKIGGKERGLKFNRATDHEFAIKVGENTNPIFNAYCMIWAALVSNCLVKGEEVDFTFEEVCDWCEELSVETYKQITDVYKSVHKFEEGLEKNKKKLVPKKIKDNVLK